jgi:uncharacterized membrane protein
MKTTFIAYVFAFIFLLVVDGVWLAIMSSRFYKVQLASLMAEKINFLPAVLFYVIYVFGLVILVIMPAFRAETSLKNVFLLGALLGFVAYGTYDFTNHATVKNWPLAVTMVDLLWGTLVTGTTSVLALYCLRFFY